MTTFAQNAITCGACGHVFTLHVLSSTNAFGSPDLDTRPPEMQRSTMSTWIRRCPACGFCAQDLTQWDDNWRAILNGPEYQAQLVDARYPDSANHFLCAAMLLQTTKQPLEAGWAMLHAAWVLDDAKSEALARICRSDAADSFLVALAAGDTVGDQRGSSEALIVDCLRRSGRSREALALIARALDDDCDDIIKQVLVFERSLITCGDVACHLISEALKE